MKNGLKTFIDLSLANLEKGLVATPASRESLDAFAMANNGSNDYLLAQMAVQFGVKLALEGIKEKMNEEGA